MGRCALTSTNPIFHDFILDAKVGMIITILILCHDEIACTGTKGCISFVSISGQNLSCVMEVSPRPLLNAIVQGDGRIAVGGSKGNCITFFAPPPLHDTVQKCASRFYP